MNLLDTASLVVTPNGFKASKLYSIIPSDGTGDMTFARTGDTATRVNPSGLIEVDAANIPRIDYLGGGCPKLLLEPQRTNLILQSQGLGSASWTKTNSPTIVSNVVVAPDGTTTADSIQSADGTNYKYISQTFSVSANSTYTFSTFVKKETTRTNFGGVSLYFSGGTAKSVYVAFNEVSGIATNLTDSNLTPVIKVDDYGTYWRLSITATDTGSNTSLIAYFYATISTNGTSLGAAAGSARTIWGLQLEAGAYATSYIPTTTASVTRNADTYEKTSVTALIGQTEGTMFWDGTINGTIPSIVVLMSLRNSSNANQYRYLSISTSSRIQFLEYNGSTQALIQTGTNFYVLGNRYKIAVAYKENDFVLYINGVQIGTDTSGTVFAADKIATEPDNLVKLNSQILWKTRLTNQELVTLTTL
jgi:hypothetical protein